MRGKNFEFLKGGIFIIEVTNNEQLKMKVNIRNDSLEINEVVDIKSEAAYVPEILEVLNESPFFEKKADYYEFKVNPFQDCFKVHDRIVNNASKNSKRYIIILESPHIDEYELKENKYKKGTLLTTDVLKPLKAANGETGKNLENLFSIFKFLTNQKDFEYVLINRVNYQTSLGSFLGNKKNTYPIIRDNIFKKIWRAEKVQEDFMNRLNNFLEVDKEVIIINASTTAVDVGANEFKNFLLKQENLQVYNIMHLNHPSAWNIEMK
ncbi:hypothetical protein [Kurthia huakuii]|uniref:hypothetical protein n=1 Tax=Kurthia huakuii TaxID=1421019 RepID=UPI0004967DDC|nr:hypothetical protein [Kurthia huakuii]MBM7699349.1 hypothetical protein [Kurthia huakuii]